MKNSGAAASKYVTTARTRTGYALFASAAERDLIPAIVLSGGAGAPSPLTAHIASASTRRSRARQPEFAAIFKTKCPPHRNFLYRFFEPAAPRETNCCTGAEVGVYQ